MRNCTCCCTDRKVCFTAPTIDIDSDVFFLGTEEEIADAEAQEARCKEFWDTLLQRPGFCGCQFESDGHGHMMYLTHSIRPGVYWQLSYFGCDGQANMHGDYAEKGEQNEARKIHSFENLLTTLSNFSIRQTLFVTALFSH